MDNIIVAIFAALLGIVVGAAINALSDDLPHRKPISLPHYPNGAPRSQLAWSGLLAFLTSQREGPSIRLTPEEEKNLSLEEIADLEFDTRLGWRHPLVEISMAAFYAFLVFYAPNPERLIIWMIYLAILMLITVIDLEHRLILFVVIVPSVLLALIINALFPDQTPEGGNRPYQEYIIGGIVGGSVFFLMYLGGGMFVDVMAAARGRQISEVAFGFGDVMLAILCGIMIGWRSMIFAMFITVFAGAAGAILYMASRLLLRQRYTMYTALPYGPYIVLGTVMMMVFINEFRDWMR